MHLINYLIKKINQQKFIPWFNIARPSWESSNSPQLSVHQWVVVQDEGLQVDQAPHLGRQAVQLVVAQVQVQQVRQVDEQLVGDGVDAVVAQVQHQHVPAVLQVPGDLRQLVVAQVLMRAETNSGFKFLFSRCLLAL